MKGRRHDRPTDKLRLTLLGGVDLTDNRGHRLQSVLSQPKRVALLTYLAVEGRDRLLRRDELTTVFWPRRNDERARKALRDALYFLRRALGDDVLLTPGDEVGLDWDRFECDAVELLEAVEAGYEERARDVYGGELLPGFHISGSVAFEEWLERTRRALGRGAALQSTAKVRGSSQAVRYQIGSLGWILTSIGVATLLAVALVRIGDPSTAAMDPEALQRRLVVLPFENRTDLDSLDLVGHVVAEHISDVALRAALTPVMPALDARQALAQVAGEGEDSRATTTTIAELTRSRYVISGSFRMIDDDLEFTGRLTDVERGALLAATDPVRAPAPDPMRAIEAAASTLLGALGTAVDTVFAPFEGAFASPSYAAYRAFAIGAEKMVQGLWAESSESFRRAVRESPTFVLAHYAGWNAARDAGQREVMDSLVAAALYLEPSSRFERLLLMDLGAEHRGIWSVALDANRELARMAPGVFEYRAAWVASNLGRYQEAKERLEAIDPQRGFVAGWVPYWIFLTSSYHALGEYERELETARKAAERFSIGCCWAPHMEARALAARGSGEEALEEVRAVVGLGPLEWSGMVQLIQAAEFAAHGHHDLATTARLEVIESFRPVEVMPGLPGSMADWIPDGHVLADALLYTDSFDAAEGFYRQLATAQPEWILWKGHLGVLAARRGDEAGARRIADELAHMDSGAWQGGNTGWRARIASTLGDQEEATRLIKVALAQGLTRVSDHWRGIEGIDLHGDPDLLSLRGYPPFDELARPQG